MILQFIVNRNARLSSSLLSKSKLSKKDIHKIKPFDLMLYHKKVSLTRSLDEANKDIEELVSETIMAVLNNDINLPDYVSYRVPHQFMSMDDFYDILTNAKISEMRKLAILFSLEVLDSISDAVTITRKMADKLIHTKISYTVSRSVPANIRLNYLFWEQHEEFEMTTPLLGLEGDFDELFEGMPFQEVKDIYAQSYWVGNDRNLLEFTTFLKHISNI